MIVKRIATGLTDSTELRLCSYPVIVTLSEYTLNQMRLTVAIGRNPHKHNSPEFRSKVIKLAVYTGFVATEFLSTHINVLKKER